MASSVLANRETGEDADGHGTHEHPAAMGDFAVAVLQPSPSQEMPANMSALLQHYAQASRAA